MTPNPKHLGSLANDSIIARACHAIPRRTNVACQDAEDKLDGIQFRQSSRKKDNKDI
jgi:hypothetical protein